MIIIPDRQTKTLTQTNRGNLLGSLWSSFNIELQDNLGTIRVANRMKLLTKTGDSNATNLGLPLAFKAFDGLLWTVAGTRVFRNSLDGSSFQTSLTAFIEDTSSGAVITYNANFSDLENFNGTLISVANTKVYSKASDGSGAGAWSERATITAASGDFSHKLCYFKKFDRIYIVDNASQVKSMDTNWAVQASLGDYFIDLGTQSPDINTIVATSQKLWIGTISGYAASKNFTNGVPIYEWDGISPQVTNEYRIPGIGTMSLVVRKDIPYVLDSNGILRAFTGTGFAEVGRLPLKPGQVLGYDQFTTTPGAYVHPNGMVVTENDTIQVLIGNRLKYGSGTTEQIVENLPSGVWEWSEKNGFVHKQSLSYMPPTSTSVTDYGQNRLVQVGALANVKRGTIAAQNTIIAGVAYYTNATSSLNGIFIDAPYPTNDATYSEGQKYGYFVTSWIPSTNLKDTWQKIALKHRKFLTSTDKITLKYRTTEADPIEISIIWTSTTTFTTSTDLTLYKGYEVEGLQGTGSGFCAHIINIDVANSVYTVTVDETFTGASGTAKMRVQAWKKILSITGQLTESKIQTIPNCSSERIQVKCCMQFTGDNEVHEMIVINSPQSLLA